MSSASDLRTVLDRFRDKERIPAVGACILGPDDHLNIEAVGVRIRGGHDPVRLDDRWHLGSCGKSITAVLYGRLVERGDAEWKVPLSDLFPGFPKIDPGWGTVTIDDVLVHEAGLPANMSNSELRAAFHDTRALRDQRIEVAARALARSPRHPGRFRYSNLGYIIIGAAIERITDRPFEEALHEHVLNPLGITSGGFGPPSHLWGHSNRRLQLGPVFIPLGRGLPVDPLSPESDNPAVMSPAGRLHLTLQDWASFQRTFLTTGDGFLRPETVERILTPSSGSGRRQAMGWAPAVGLDDILVGQQGSNSYWVATALMDRSRERIAMVVCNDGRSSLLSKTGKFAAQLLSTELAPRP